MLSPIFARTELLIGSAGLQKLQSCRVAVFGLGGVGSYAAEALARAGIGYLFLVDHDTVDLTNVNRQLHALTNTVGQAKTQLMKERLSYINPALVVETRQQRFTPDLASAMLDHLPIDFVVDAIDDVDNKVALIAACVERKLALISAMGAGNKLDPTLFKIDSIWKTSVCPLARVMRKKLRATGIKENIPVVYSLAPPVATGDKSNSKERFISGSISFVPAVAGLLMAGFVVNSLLGFLSPAELTLA